MGVAESRPWVSDDMVPEPSLVGSAVGVGGGLAPGCESLQAGG